MCVCMIVYLQLVGNAWMHAHKHFVGMRGCISILLENIPSNHSRVNDRQIPATKCQICTVLYIHYIYIIYTVCTL